LGVGWVSRNSLEKFLPFLAGLGTLLDFWQEKGVFWGIFEAESWSLTDKLKVCSL
jgi:hypothetical protein